MWRELCRDTLRAVKALVIALSQLFITKPAREVIATMAEAGTKPDKPRPLDAGDGSGQSPPIHHPSKKEAAKAPNPHPREGRNARP